MPDAPSTTGACAHEESTAKVQAYQSSPVTNWAGIGREVDARLDHEMTNPAYLTKQSEAIENTQKGVESRLRRGRAISDAHEVNPHIPEWDELKAAKGRADLLIDKAKTFAILMEERRVRISLLVSALQREQNSQGSDASINDAVDRLNRILASAEKIENDLGSFQKKLENRKWEEDERRLQLEGRLLVPPMGQGTYEAYERTLSKMEKVHNKNKNTIREWFKRFFMLIRPMELSEDAIKRHLLLNLQEDPAAFFLSNIMRPVQEIVDRMLNMYDKSYRKPNEVIESLRKAKRGPDEDLVYFMSDLEWKLQDIKYSFTDGLYESHRNQILKEKLMENVGEHTLREVNRRLMEAEDNQEQLDITELYQEAARVEKYAEDWSKKPARRSRVNQARPAVPLLESPEESEEEPEAAEQASAIVNHVRSYSNGRRSKSRSSRPSRSSGAPIDVQYAYQDRDPLYDRTASAEPRIRKTLSEIKKEQDNYMKCFLNMAVEDGIKSARKEGDDMAVDREDAESHPRRYRDEMPKDDPEYSMTRQDAAEFWDDIPSEVAAFELEIEREERRAEAMRMAERGRPHSKWRRNSQQREYEKKRPSAAWNYRRDREDALRTPGRSVPSYRSYFTHMGSQNHHEGRQPRDHREGDPGGRRYESSDPHQTQVNQETHDRRSREDERRLHSRNVGPPTISSSSSETRVVCAKCGWTGGSEKRDVSYPPMISKLTASGELITYPEPGSSVETSHSTEQCPKYQVRSNYPCRECSKRGKIAFHFPDKCLDSVSQNQPGRYSKESPRAFVSRPDSLQESHSKN